MFMNTKYVRINGHLTEVKTLKELFPHLQEKEEQKEKNDREMFRPFITKALFNGQVVMN